MLNVFCIFNKFKVEFSLFTNQNFFLSYFPLEDYTQIIMLSEREKDFDFSDEFLFKKETVKKSGNSASSLNRSQSVKTMKKDGGHHMSSTSFNVPFQFVESGRRNQVMICEGRKYIQNNKYGEKIYWKCSKWHDGCKARAITLTSQPDCIIRRNEHNHPETSTVKEESLID